METTKNETTAMIYNLSGEILMNKATEEQIKKITKLAKEQDLLALLKAEFSNVGNNLMKVGKS